MRLPVLQLSCRLFFGKASHHPGLSAPLQPRFGPQRLPVFPKTKIAFERDEICECDGHTVHKLTQRRLTADWLAPQESDYSQMHSKVSSDWLPSFIKATRPVRKIFKMVGYFTDSPRISVMGSVPRTRTPYSSFSRQKSSRYCNAQKDLSVVLEQCCITMEWLWMDWEIKKWLNKHLEWGRSRISYWRKRCRHGLSLSPKCCILRAWWTKWIKKQGAYVENDVPLRPTNLL